MRPVVSLPGSEQDLTALFLPISCMSGTCLTWAGSLEQPTVMRGWRPNRELYNAASVKQWNGKAHPKGRRAGDVGIASEGWTGLNPSGLWFCCSHGANEQDKMGTAAEAGVGWNLSSLSQAALMPRSKYGSTEGCSSCGLDRSVSRKELTPKPSQARSPACTWGWAATAMFAELLEHCQADAWLCSPATQHCHGQ